MTRIRRATQADIGDIAALDDACFPAEEIDSFRDVKDVAWWVAVEDSKVVGFAGARIWRWMGESALYLHRCGVSKSARGQGLQRRFIRARLAFGKREELDEAWTYTSYANTRSSNNLIRCGFELWIPSHWGGRDPLRLDDNAFLYWKRPLK